MQSKSVTMLHPDPLPVRPSMPCPLGFRIRCLRPDEGPVWAHIEHIVNEFANPDAALDRFRWEFAPFPQQIAQRCLVVETTNGDVVGTTSAWYHPAFQGGLWGRLHWVAILLEYQGKGLARPLLVAALNRMAVFHRRAFLDSDPSRIKALRLYLDYGFRPRLHSAEDHAAWSIVSRNLQHPALQQSLRVFDEAQSL